MHKIVHHFTKLSVSSSQIAHEFLYNSPLCFFTLTIIYSYVLSLGSSTLIRVGKNPAASLWVLYTRVACYLMSKGGLPTSETALLSHTQSVQKTSSSVPSEDAFQRLRRTSCRDVTTCELCFLPLLILKKYFSDSDQKDG